MWIRRESGTEDGVTRAQTRLALESEDVLEAIEAAATVVCKRWKPALIWLLAIQHRRYTELARLLSGATPKMLTQQLRELERDGLVSRESRLGGPRHVVYALTPIGEALRPILEHFTAWGQQYEEFKGSRRPEERERALPGTIGDRRAMQGSPPERASETKRVHQADAVRAEHRSERRF